MTLPKLLAQVTITATNNSWSHYASSPVATEKFNIPTGTYDSMLEVVLALDEELGDHSNYTFHAHVLSTGHIRIREAAAVAWTMNWTDTDDALQALLGFSGTEAVEIYGGERRLTSDNMHTRGWYPPVGVAYPNDRLRICVREQETCNGGLSQYTDAQVHRYRDMTFHLVPLEAAEEGGTGADGYGSTTNWTSRTFSDFWQYVADRHFRFYADRANGTEAIPGTEGTHFVTCRRMGDTMDMTQVDPDSWAYWDCVLHCKVTGE